MGLIAKDITRNSPNMDVIDIVKLIRGAINTNLGRTVIVESSAAPFDYIVATDIIRIALNVRATDGAVTVIMPRPVEATLPVWFIPIGDGTPVVVKDADGVGLGTITTLSVITNSLNGTWGTW